MAYTTINKSKNYFNTKLYTGNGGTNAQTGVGFQPDWTWIKNRSATDQHALFDAVRGVNKVIRTSNNSVESTQTDGLMAFGTDGFTVGASGSVNTNSNNFASWNWKAGTSVSGNTTGSGTYKSYTGSVNSTSKFSIIKYVGNGSAGHTIPHHLGQAPTFTIVKALGLTESWQVISSGLAADKFIQLNADSAEVSQGSYNRFNSTRPSSTVVTLGSDDHTNKNNENFIMYNFCDVDGFSKSGSYTGNNNADGPFIYTGFKPAWVMVKKYTATNHWIIWDDKRSTPIDGANIINKKLMANLNNAEGGADDISFLSNGFKFHTNTGDWNESQSYIYIAFGQSLVGSNNVPCTAR